MQKIWTDEAIAELVYRIKEKVKRGEKLTCGEDLIHDKIKRGKPISARYLEEIEHYIGIEDE